MHWKKKSRKKENLSPHKKEHLEIKNRQVKYLWKYTHTIYLLFSHTTHLLFQTKSSSNARLEQKNGLTKWKNVEWLHHWCQKLRIPSFFFLLFIHSVCVFVGHALAFMKAEHIKCNFTIESSKTLVHVFLRSFRRFDLRLLKFEKRENGFFHHCMTGFDCFMLHDDYVSFF